MIKEVIVLFFSGAVVPVTFFSDGLKKVTYMMPFEAIYNTPLKILTDQTYSNLDYMSMLGKQIFWIIIVFTAGSTMR